MTPDPNAPSAIDLVLDNVERGARELRAEGLHGAGAVIARVGEARAELSALRSRLAELEPPRGTSAAFYLLSAGDPEC